MSFGVLPTDKVLALWKITFVITGAQYGHLWPSLSSGPLQMEDTYIKEELYNQKCPWGSELIRSSPNEPLTLI